MEFRLLGPVRAVVNGQSVPLGGPKSASILAALLLARGQVVPSTRLVDILWPEDPPSSARALIQTYISQLRRALGEHGGADLISTQAPGYLMRLPAEASDVLLFEQLMKKARQTTEPEARVEALTKALSLWHGPVLAGLGQTGLTGEADRLEGLRLIAVEECCAAKIALGRDEELIPELTQLAKLHPTNERICAQLMTVLYRAGRQADALTAYRHAREALVDELGVEPGAELSLLHTQILRADPALKVPTVKAAVRQQTPTELPPAVADFTGRADEIRDLIDSVCAGQAMAVHVIAGRGGVGKSALAAFTAESLAASFPDGQLYAELRGMSDDPADPAEVLARFLRAFGVPVEEIGESVEQRARRFRELTADRRILVLLDDARDVLQVRHLLPAGPACAVLVTSRNRLTEVPGARLTELEMLTCDEALELLGRIVGRDRVMAEKSAARDIVEHCAGLPLALRIAGGRLASRRNLPLSWLAGRLADENRRLSELSPGQSGIRSTFELSYRGLTPVAQNALAALGFLGAPAFSSWLVSWLLDIGEPDAEQVVEQLVDAQLADFMGLDGIGRLRYRMHDLVRIYARERFTEVAGPGAANAVARVMTNWLSLIHRIGTASPPAGHRWHTGTIVEHEPPAEMVAQVLAEPSRWFEADQQAIVVAVERAAALGLDDLVAEFAGARYDEISVDEDRFDFRTRVNDAALRAVRAAGNRRGEAVVLAEFGQLRYDQDRYPEAVELLREALAGFTTVGDTRGEALTMADLGAAHRELGEFPESLRMLDAAAERLHRIGDDTATGNALRLAGSVRVEIGQFAEARRDLEASLAAYERAGSRRGRGMTLRSLGLYFRATGEFAEAVEVCAQSAEIFEALGDDLMQAYAVRALAKAQLRLGLAATALPQLEWALSVSRRMQDRWGVGATLRVLGQLHLSESRFDLAQDCLDKALSWWQGLGIELWQARTKLDLAQLAQLQGRDGEALTLRRAALQTFRAYGSREYDEVTAAYGVL